MNRRFIELDMSAEAATILLSDSGEILWADAAAAVLLDCPQTELTQMGLPLIGRSGKNVGALGPVADGFLAVLAKRLEEVRGTALLADKVGRKMAIRWRMVALPPNGGQQQMLLTLWEAPQPTPDGRPISSYRDVFEHAVEGIFRTALDGQVIEVNPALATMYGYTGPAEFMDAVPNLTRLYVRQNRREEFVQVMLERGFVAGFESEFLRADGSVIWLSEYARAVMGENRALLYFEGSMIDVTERKRAEAASQRSEEKFRRLAETTRVVPFEFDVAAQMFTYVGPQAEVLFGPEFRSGLTFERWAAMLHTEDMEHGTRFAREGAFRSNKDFQTEFRVHAADGRVIWIKQIVQRDTAEDHGNHVRGFLFEVTEAKLAEEERERSRGQLRELAARTQEVREEERMSIAREIHDELGQGLTLLKIDLSWLSGRLTETVPDEARKPLEERIGKMEQMIHWTLLTVRRILSALRPPLLDELGLKDAIEFQMEEFSQRVGIRYELDMAPVGTLPANSSTAVFRVFQEALTNVARHANASRIKVYLREVNSHLVMKVQDNGSGISQEKLLHTGNFGLLGMQERAWAMGGELELHASPRSGTTVTLRIPLVQKAAAA